MYAYISYYQLMMSLYNNHMYKTVVLIVLKHHNSYVYHTYYIKSVLNKGIQNVLNFLLLQVNHSTDTGICTTYF